MKASTLYLALGITIFSSASHSAPNKDAEAMRKALGDGGGLSSYSQSPPEEIETNASPGIIPDNNPLSGTQVKEPIRQFKSTMTTIEGGQAAYQRQTEQGIQDLTDALKIEAERFGVLLQDRFAVSLLDTGDGLVRQFVATGVLKMNPDIYSRMESGLAAMYIADGKINGQSRPVCYVLNNPSRSPHLWEGFVPSGDRSKESIQWAASYLMAHEIGHCLDKQQRENETASGQWNALQLERLGIPIAAFDRTFGAGSSITQRDYRRQQVVLYRDGALLQYQERVADAFAVLWMINSRAPDVNLKTIWDARTRYGNLGDHKAHFTVPTLQKAYAIGMNIKTPQSIDMLWGLARQAQFEGGVDRSLHGNSALVHAEAEGKEAAPDTKPGEISKNGTLPAVVRFDRLPKFGK